LILHNSRESAIPLEKELEALDLYLELESLRFEERFKYKISVEGKVDASQVKVPPLIIQPLAENAIWHGLMQKKEEGHLDIKVYQQEEVLFCKITDDGIGRKKAAETKNRSTSAGNSLGMRITANRIAILKNETENKNQIEVTDIVHPDGSPGGTEVLLKIPVHYD
jgi:LytS/YehU family sensor histidine kinase